MATTDSAATAPQAPQAGSACGNCGTPLLGPHCHACGQPVKGLVRHFGSIIGDFLDTAFNLDGRTPRTLWPLFAKPGFLTCEYFEGRRVRYVTPVRLFFFLAIVTVFVAQFTVDIGNDDVLTFGDDEFGNAVTLGEVEAIRERTLRQLAKTRAALPPVADADAGVRDAEARVREAAAARIEVIQAATARGEPPPAADEPSLAFGDGGNWDPETNPIAIGWLPPFANRWLNAQTGRTIRNVKRLREEPGVFADAALGAVPSTLFVLLPVFALMLKAAYVFRRRLYMEHLIVALHSHAFLCLALLLMFVLVALQDWLAPAQGALRAVFDLLQAALWVWMPLYLLLSQKRIYRQGWTMTLLKYSVLGICYVVLLSFGAAFTVLASIVWM